MMKTDISIVDQFLPFTSEIQNSDLFIKTLDSNIANIVLLSIYDIWQPFSMNKKENAIYQKFKPVLALYRYFGVVA